MNIDKIAQAMGTAACVLSCLALVLGGLFVLWGAIGTASFLTISGLFLSLTALCYWLAE